MSKTIAEERKRTRDKEQHLFPGTLSYQYDTFEQAKEELNRIKSTSSCVSSDNACTIFAFQMDKNGSLVYLPSTLKQLERICNRDQSDIGRHGLEVIDDGMRMKLFCRVIVNKQSNNNLNEKNMLDSLKFYITQAYSVIFPNMTALASDDIVVEHQDILNGDVYRIKIPERYGVVSKLDEQCTFFHHVQTLAKRDLQTNDEQNRTRAKNLIIFRQLDNGMETQEWCTDMSVYSEKHHSILNSTAAYGDKRNSGFKLLDRPGMDKITSKEWQDSLIVSISASSPQLVVPAELLSKSITYLTKKKRVVDVIQGCPLIENMEKPIALSFTSSEDKNNIETQLECLDQRQPQKSRFLPLYTNLRNISYYALSKHEEIFIRMIMNDIDPEWCGDEPIKFVTKSIFLNEKLDVLPRKLLVIPHSTYCPIAKKHHKMCKTQLLVSQDAKLEVLCSSSSHYLEQDQFNSKFCNINVMIDLINMKAFNKQYHNRGREIVQLNNPTSLEGLLYYTWGVEEWRKEFNLKYSFIINNGIIAYRCTDGESFFIAESNDLTMRKYFRNATAYSVEEKDRNKDEKSWILLRYNPFDTWMNWNERTSYADIVFQPTSLLQTHSTGNILNSWFGSPLKPKYSANPCPKLLQHIFEVIVSGNSEHYEYLLDYCSWMVQKPDVKPQVAIVLVSSEEGAGKNIFLNILMDIFGSHSIQITHDQHFNGTFNGHLSKRVLIVLNEWSKERVTSNHLFKDIFKSAVTESRGIEHNKLQRAESKNNYWCFWITLNSDDPFDNEGSRRIFEPKVSCHRVGDHKHFSELVNEIENGGKEEFLRFLLDRKRPDGWTPWANKPKSHVDILTSLKNDPKNIFLSFLLTIAEKGCWKTSEGDDIIAYDEARKVKTNIALTEYREAMKKNDVWSVHPDITQERQLNAKFTQYLPKGFSYKKNYTFSPGDRKSAFFFPSMKQIRSHLESTYGVRFPKLNIRGVNNKSQRPLKKARTDTIVLSVVGNVKNNDIIEEEIEINDDDHEVSVHSPNSNYLQTQSSFSSESTLVEQLREKGLQIKDNLADGDCLPYSILDFRPEYKNNPNLLRFQVVEYVRQHWRDIREKYPELATAFESESSTEDWSKKAGTSKEWCELDFAFVVTLMLRLHLTCYFVNEKEDLQRIDFPSLEGEIARTEGSIQMAYMNGNHYVSVWPLSSAMGE